MRLEHVYSGVRAWWALHRMRRLLQCVEHPNEQQVNDMLGLLRQSETHAAVWPRVWSEGWFKALVESTSLLANNVCCTLDVAHYTQEFLYATAGEALRKDNFLLLDALKHRLDAREAPLGFWALLRQADPALGVRMLASMPNACGLDEEKRREALSIVAAQEPHLWMYEYAQTYAQLVRAWDVSPPVHWWHALYTGSLHEPPNANRLFAQSFQHQKITQIVRIRGQATYAYAQLQAKRSLLLARDPWFLVRSAFFGDVQACMQTSMETSLCKESQVSIDAYAILRHYYPSSLAPLHTRGFIPTHVQAGQPRLAIAVLLGMRSPIDAHEAFSQWVANEYVSRIATSDSLAVDHLV